MNKAWQALEKSALVILAVVACPAVSLAQVNVIISGGFRAVYLETLPEFERATGIKIRTTSGASQGIGPDTIGAQLRRNVPADVVIMNRVGLAELMAEGRIIPGTDVELAQTPLGVAVRAGAAKPDISTVEAFKRTLLRARSVAIDGSTTGAYVTTTLFPRLGLSDVMAKKTLAADPEVVATGGAEIAIRPVSELVPVKGVDLVGTVPAELQYVAVFAAAVVADSKQVGAARRLIAFLTSDATARAINKNGMEPPTARAESRPR